MERTFFCLDQTRYLEEKSVQEKPRMTIERAGVLFDMRSKNWKEVEVEVEVEEFLLDMTVSLEGNGTNSTA